MLCKKIKSIIFVFIVLISFAITSGCNYYPKTIYTENGIWTDGNMTIDTTEYFDNTRSDYPNSDHCYCTFIFDDITYDCIILGDVESTAVQFYDKTLFRKWKQLNSRLSKLTEEELQF